MLEIDGSQGEGGGQILRTSLGLSLLTGTPVRLYSIRAKRDPPGLQRQHLAAVNAAAEIGKAEAKGATVGSRELVFRPGRVEPGAYSFSVGTAGSATLVLQAILPPLLTASGRTTVSLEGGTHNPWAPPFDFLEKTFLPILQQMGPRVKATLERRGFYPAGGGRVAVTVEAAPKLARLDLLERGEVRAIRATAVVASLPAHIARRELRVVEERLKPVLTRVVEDRTARGQGNVLTIELESERLAEVITGFGKKGVPAETIASRACDEARVYLDSGVPVGEHLADQLLIPFALAGGGAFVSAGLSTHARTNMDVIVAFLGTRFTIEPIGPARSRVAVAGR